MLEFVRDFVIWTKIAFLQFEQQAAISDDRPGSVGASVGRLSLLGLTTDGGKRFWRVLWRGVGSRVAHE